MRRTRSKASSAARQAESRSPVRSKRVNQPMIDRMVALRHQGHSEKEVATKLKCSERTVRRHTSGVRPRLVHPGDPVRVDLVQWCAHQIIALQKRLKLDVKELDRVMKLVRKAVGNLDPLTVRHLETDRRQRIEFLGEVLLPDIMSQIRIRRVMEQIRAMSGGEPA